MFETFRQFGWTEAEFNATKSRTLHKVIAIMKGLEAKRGMELE